MNGLSDFRPASRDLIQSRLLALAGLFLFLYSLCLTLSTAVLERSPVNDLRWSHWLGWGAWVVVFYALDRQICRWAPGRDPFLLPIIALLSGWGMLSVWRLLPAFGLRQGMWIVVSSLVVILGLRLPPDLGFLRRYKYVWLTSGILLTGMTLLLGVNPMGYGPRMWLGLLGIFFQPSEPLKLMLIVYLAAYMADNQLLLSLANRFGKPDWKSPILPLLAPTLIMTGLALAVLAIQRDLGAAAMLLFLYAAIVYVTTGMKRVVAYAAGGLALASLAGYWAYSLVRVRVDAWLNPWLEPSGKSYQIVQSLLAVANGGLFGRGPGLGNPGIVPLAHSDLIFAALVEETGLWGAAGMLLLLTLLVGRGLRAALKTPDRYRRYLAAGLTAYLAGQSLLIIGGTLRLLPLTGITLPFVSYGGSSLLVSFIALLLLVQISRPTEGWCPPASAQASQAQPILQLAAGLGLGLLAAALATGWWGIARSGELLSRTDNPRRSISDLYVQRGAILDRADQPINQTIGEAGAYTRLYAYPTLSNVVGYTNPTYGQSGLEASQDNYLRGLQGNRALEIWWRRLVYGQPPPGLDIRLSLDLELQQLADKLFRNQVGALVILNARTGEMLAMASYPGFDAREMDRAWEELVNDPSAPLLNRAILGRYAASELERLTYPDGFNSLGLFPTPPFELPSGDLPADASLPGSTSRGYSPLQMALAAAVISGEGLRPAPQLVMAVNDPRSGWLPLPAKSQPVQALTVERAAKLAQKHTMPGLGFWQVGALEAAHTGQAVAWWIGGSLPAGGGTPYALALVIESDAQELAERIGQTLLHVLLWGKPPAGQ